MSRKAQIGQFIKNWTPRTPVEAALAGSLIGCAVILGAIVMSVASMAVGLFRWAFS